MHASLIAGVIIYRVVPKRTAPSPQFLFLMPASERCRRLARLHIYRANVFSRFGHPNLCFGFFYLFHQNANHELEGGAL
jgi:hypothetical protein